MTTERELYEHAGLAYVSTTGPEVRVHELKAWPSYFQRDKPWELRRLDRDYLIGDYVLLREFEHDHYTGASRVRRIEQIDVSETHGPLYAIEPDHCILTLGLPQAAVENAILASIDRPVLRWVKP